MERDYSIETLCETFAQHAAEVDKFHKKHKEEYPDADTCDDFNLATALSVMAHEIQKLKILQRGQNPFSNN